MKYSREHIISMKTEILQAIFLFPPIATKDHGDARSEYEEKVKPRQQSVETALRNKGLASCCYPGCENAEVGNGVKVTIMKDPWPEIDLNVAGADKGKALARFLKNKDVLKYLRYSSIDPASQVAVFGDAANDVPMFKAMGGERAGLRIHMPHADDLELIKNSNIKSEVADILHMICDAKKQSEHAASGLKHEVQT